MSQLFEMCQAIMNFPKNEMTVDDVVEAMNGSGINQHSIRCALSKIASKSVLVEPTHKHRGRVKIYKKRADIEDQWAWMMAHKSPSDRLVLPDTATVVKSRQQETWESAGERETLQTAAGMQAEPAATGRILKELAKIGKVLGSIEDAIRENTEALRALEKGKPTVVVRREKDWKQTGS